MKNPVTSAQDPRFRVKAFVFDLVQINEQAQAASSASTPLATLPTQPIEGERAAHESAAGRVGEGPLPFRAVASCQQRADRLTLCLCGAEATERCNCGQALCFDCWDLSRDDLSCPAPQCDRLAARIDL